MTTTQSTAAAGSSVSERLVAALADTWRAIQARHPDVPDVAIVIGSGTGGRRMSTKLGHFASRRWAAVVPAGTEPAVGEQGQAQPEEFVHELLVGGEGLVRGGVEVLGTLLHEAAHALAEARGIPDTSVRGTYHNQRFRALAVELGLDVAEEKHRGWSTTSVPEATAALYADQVQALTTEITVYRMPTATKAPGSPPAGRNLAALCGCPIPRRIQVARSTFEAGEITCAVCAQPFTLAR